jgi:hypothetical protein
MCQILLLHRNWGRNGLHFEHLEGRKNALYIIGIQRNIFTLGICD